MACGEQEQVVCGVWDVAWVVIMSQLAVGAVPQAA